MRINFLYINIAFWGIIWRKICELGLVSYVDGSWLPVPLYRSKRHIFWQFRQLKLALLLVLLYYLARNLLVDWNLLDIKFVLKILNIRRRVKMGDYSWCTQRTALFSRYYFQRLVQWIKWNSRWCDLRRGLKVCAISTMVSRRQTRQLKLFRFLWFRSK